MRLLICLLPLLILPQTSFAAPPAAPDKAPVEVMVVGVFHLSNPGHDLHNMQVDDVLAPKRQAELAAINKSLLRFHPTKVAAEWPQDTVAERYPQYLAGTLAPSKNEVVQLGFRLAKAAGDKPVYGIDVDGDFPYEAVKAYADAHGQTALLDEQSANYDRMDVEQEKLLSTKGISAVLRDLNGPHGLSRDNAFYRTALRIGSGAEQPGADLLTAWYRRNFLICANLLQLSAPGDRIVLFYGAGHAFLLRQCVAETPGFKLVEPNAYLPMDKAK
jgi:hypothetical protein